MIKKYLTLIALLSIFAMFVSCSKDDDDNQKVLPKRTVLIYAVAENNLDTQGFFQMDYDEILNGVKTLNDNENLLMFVDRLDSKQKPEIIKFDREGAHTVKSYTEDFYCTAPERMGEVMKWVADSYPAQSYGLSFWGHGSGWIIEPDTIANNIKLRAYGPDNGADSEHKGTKWINFPTLAKVIANNMPHLDFIFFDCCNMQTVENAYELRRVCDYLIGSPAEIPGKGAPYDHIVKDFFADKNQLPSKLIDDIWKYNSCTTSFGSPLSAIRTEALDNLLYATQHALSTFMTYDRPSFDMSNIIYYYSGSQSANRPIMYDMRNFFRKNLTEEEFRNWDQALSEAVVYKLHPTKNWESMLDINFYSFQMTDDNYGGISMFVPHQQYDLHLSRLYISPNITIHNTQWGQAINWKQFGW